MRVLIDGEPVDPQVAAVSVFDWAIQRGDGCFEVLRGYHGKAFQVTAHLDRLANSAAALDLPLPPRHHLESWVERVAAAGGDCLVRVIATRGGDDPEVGAPPCVVVLHQPLPDLPDSLWLGLVAAPWHPGGVESELAAVKSISYGPNMAATRTAQRQGFHDALLVSREGILLEGPTFSVGWFAGDTLETPSLDLGILESITRNVALEEAARLRIPIREDRFPVEHLAEVDEVFLLSTVRQVMPVTRVGQWSFDAGPRTVDLARGFAARVAAEVGVGRAE